MTNFEDEQDNEDRSKNSNNSISRKKKSFFVSTIFLNSNNNNKSAGHPAAASGIIRSRSFSNDIELKSDYDVNPSPETDVLDLKMTEHPVEKKDNKMKQTSKSSSTFPRLLKKSYPTEAEALFTIFTILLTFLGKYCNAHMLHALGVYNIYMVSAPTVLVLKSGRSYATFGTNIPVFSANSGCLLGKKWQK